MVQGAKELLIQFRRANENNDQVVEINRSIQSRWKNPPPDSYKVNWDAALNSKEKRTGIGVIIQDNLGRVFAAQSKTIYALYDPTTAEAEGALYALELSRDSGLHEVMLEGDSKIVVIALTGMESNCCRYGQVIDDAKAVLNAFRGWEVCHVKREANMAAVDLQRRRLIKAWIGFGLKKSLNVLLTVLLTPSM